MKTAKFVKELDGWAGDARLYELSEPVLYETWDENGVKTNYVAVSRVVGIYASETYIFPADENGKTLSWLELEGSSGSPIPHEEALERAGYTVE